MRIVPLAASLLLLAACAHPPEEDLNAPGAGMISLGRQMQERGDLPASLGFYERAIERDPDNFFAHRAMAELLHRMKNLDSAAAHYQAALKLYPHDAVTLRGYGRLLLQQDKLAEAQDVLAQAVKADGSDSKALTLYAVTLDYAGRHDEAQHRYRRALEAEPDNLVTLNNLAYSYLLSGQVNAAIALLEPRQHDPAAAPALRQNLALAYGLAGMELDAERLLRRDLPPAKLRETLDFYRARRAELGTAQAHALLGSYGTEALAQHALVKLAPVIAAKSRKAKLVIEPQLMEVGGTPRFALVLKADQADELRRICDRLAADGQDCVLGN
jgi:Flp pilus assembly protein TadD